MAWRKLGVLGRIRRFLATFGGHSCVELDDEAGACTYGFRDEDGFRVVKLGTAESNRILREGHETRLAIGHWGDYEIELFAIARTRRGKWFAYRRGNCAFANNSIS